MNNLTVCHTSQGEFLDSPPSPRRRARLLTTSNYLCSFQDALRRGVMKAKKQFKRLDMKAPQVSRGKPELALTHMHVFILTLTPAMLSTT